MVGWFQSSCRKYGSFTRARFGVLSAYLPVSALWALAELVAVVKLANFFRFCSCAAHVPIFLGKGASDNCRCPPQAEIVRRLMNRKP